MCAHLGKAYSPKKILIIGGGVAGITAALDLAASGASVHLVERGSFPGGNVAKLEKVYPTDHCAFCHLWTEIKKCMDHPCVTVHLQARVKKLSRRGRDFQALIAEAPAYIDPERCIFCGKCRKACASDKNPPGIRASSGAIHPAWEHASPPFYRIDFDMCSRCGDCQTVCPTGAIDINRPEESVQILAGGVIWATGFREADLSSLKEFGSDTHPDIMSAMEFEAWAGEQGPCRGKVKRRSDGKTPKSIAFVQCAGARDRRLLPYCASVCCMHAVKQAKWVKKRKPEIDCTIFFTDLRTVGKDYYGYAKRGIDGYGLEIIRGRPGLILPLIERGKIAVKYEDTLVQQRRIRAFDMVVLSGGLEMGACQPAISEPSSSQEASGSTGALTRQEDERACGFCSGPADMADSIIKASAAALDTIILNKVKY